MLKFYTVHCRNANGPTDWFYMVIADDENIADFNGPNDRVYEVSEKDFRYCPDGSTDWPQDIRHQYSDKAKAQL